MVRSHQDPEAFVSMVRLGNLCAGGHSHWRETGHRDRGEARTKLRVLKEELVLKGKPRGESITRRFTRQAGVLD